MKITKRELKGLKQKAPLLLRKRKGVKLKPPKVFRDYMREKRKAKA